MNFNHATTSTTYNIFRVIRTFSKVIAISRDTYHCSYEQVPKTCDGAYYTYLNECIKIKKKKQIIV